MLRGLIAVAGVQAAGPIVVAAILAATGLVTVEAVILTASEVVPALPGSGPAAILGSVCGGEVVPDVLSVTSPPFVRGRGN